MRGRASATLVTVWLTVSMAVAMATATSSLAATQIGQTFTPPSGCDFPLTQIQTTSPGNIYAAPGPGVITSWSFMASTTENPQLKLKVARSAGGNDFTIVGESTLQATSLGVLNTFPTRIAGVRAGDVIGFFNATQGLCGVMGGGSYTNRSTSMGVDPPPGSTTTFTGSGTFHLDVSAVLEPDADNDGYGDETQDCAPSDASRNVDCAPPQTTISAGPKDRSRKKTATFEFTGIDARAVAGFECSLDGKPFTACSSPHTVKVKRGRHSFAVRAVDQVGNADDVPATDTWKVRKKKRKK